MAALEARLGHTPEDDLEFFSNVILVERDVWVAVKEGAVVGFLALEGECLENLYVDPTSQNQGVGHALLEFAQQRSPARLELWTFVANEGSRRFYERHGFKAIQFSTSSPPENEPDIQYRWTPPSSPPPH